MIFRLCRSSRRWPRRRPQRWYVQIVAANGRQQWRTSETYTNKRDALAAVEQLKARARDAPVVADG